MFYIIKTIHIRDDQRWCASSDGIFLDIQEALRRVEQNSCDLCEAGYNQYAAVVCFGEGMYPFGEEIQWFIWDRYGEEYMRTVRPDFMDGWALSI